MRKPWMLATDRRCLCPCHAEGGVGAKAGDACMNCARTHDRATVQTLRAQVEARTAERDEARTNYCGRERDVHTLAAERDSLAEKLHTLGCESDTLSQANAKLRAALEPFGEAVRTLDHDEDDDAVIYSRPFTDDDDVVRFVMLKAGHLTAAAQALAETPAPDPRREVAEYAMQEAQESHCDCRVTQCCQSTGCRCEQGSMGLALLLCERWAPDVAAKVQALRIEAAQ